MLIRQLQTDHEDAFREAAADFDWHRIACLLDARNDAELGRYLRGQFQPMCEAVEDTLTSEGIYAEEARLDTRDRACECNRGFGR